MKKFLPILILILVSTFIIFYRFSAIPKNLSFDEVQFAKLALSLNNKPYIPYSPLATGHSTLYFYILLASFKTFGINAFALRFPAAIFGVLSVIMFYGIISKLKNYTLPPGRQELRITNFNVLPLILSLILLTSHWFLNFSRFSFEVTFLLFLEFMSIYFLLKFDEVSKAKIPNFLRFTVFRQKISVSSFYIIFSGLFAGLSYISYTPGRIFFILPLLFIFFNNKKGQVQDLPLQKTQQYNNITIKRLLIFVIPFIIIITPLTFYLSTHIDTRIDQQLFLNNHEMPVQDKLTGLWNNISTTAFMFNIKGDVNGRHNYPNKPALNPILGLLFIIGLIISIKNWRNSYNLFFIFYFLLSIIPALMTYPWENPNMLRTFTALPSIVYFCGNAIIFIYEYFSKLLVNKNIPKYLILNTLYLLILFSCFYELRTYFKYQPTVFKQAFEIKLSLDKALKVKN